MYTNIEVYANHTRQVVQFGYCVLISVGFTLSMIESLYMEHNLRCIKGVSYNDWWYDGICAIHDNKSELIEFDLCVCM